MRLKSFPFPLVAKITEDDPDRRVRWRFRGFWEGEGEVAFEPVGDGVVVTGHERIRPRALWVLGPVIERLFLEKRLRAIWALGFRRLRRQGSG